MESEIRIEARIPSPEDYNWLRREAEWPEMDGDACIRCLPESQYVVSVFDGGELVGMGRIVGDGALCFYIQDVIVAKSHRRRGVGTAVMEALMDFIADRAVKDTYVGLMSAVGKEPFYERFGFTGRPTETLGCGMTLMWPAVAPRGEGSDGLGTA
jgi:GNAT superfamily N-acetyltransferase